LAILSEGGLAGSGFDSRVVEKEGVLTSPGMSSNVGPLPKDTLAGFAGVSKEEGARSGGGGGAGTSRGAEEAADGAAEEAGELPS
jgi:hypothetical protein